YLVEGLEVFRADIGDAKDDRAEGAVDDRRRAAIFGDGEGGLGQLLIRYVGLREVAEQDVRSRLALFGKEGVEGRAGSKLGSGGVSRSAIGKGQLLDGAGRRRAVFFLVR